ncbi:MAG: DUF2752 domain-containing protein [Ruminococcus sp.]|nr:DUF2752 domain-containing protein [Ruminococcus sp.]
MALLILVLGVVYYAVIRLTPFRIPCVFYEVTGLLCPGCGVTRMMESLIRLDFAAAFGWNPVLFCLLPVWAVSYIVYLAARPGCLQQNGWLFRVIAYGSIVVLLIFGVVRNL